MALPSGSDDEAAEKATSTTPSATNSSDDQWATVDVCDLAGMLPDGSPLPADMARRLAGYASTWTRILTDPATGTPLDAKATSDTIPNSLVPFDHSSPASGGLTRFGSLPHLCATHHQAKTDRQFSVRMAEPGRLEYVFKHGITTEVMSPDNPINIEHAKLFLEYFATPPPSPAAP
ncbi:MAG: hypothetical protein L0H69_08735, partial [Brevibacterium sp.]|nr:hypothetical protein [Brevibacterium sp.]